MKIHKMIKELQEIKKKEGNIQVVIVHTATEITSDGINGTFETTCENFEVKEHKKIGKCVRLWL